MPSEQEEGTSYQPREIGALVLAVVVLGFVFFNMPGTPTWPAPAQFKQAGFNPFVNNKKYRPPSCELTAFPWNSGKHPSCPADPGLRQTTYPTDELTCTTDKVPDNVFFKPLINAQRIQWVNFTGPVSKQAVSAIVVLPQAQFQNMPVPVVYALHARDQSYENMWAENKHLSFQLDKLHLGFKGWVQDTMCELNDPRMEPHILVIPLRGGDRMWIDCKDPLACALETQVTKDLVPYIDQRYNTKTGASDRACIGYSMGASGCINYAIKHPTVFGSILVQSPGVWPRFVDWEQLTSTEGSKTSAFSTRDFLLERVFDGKKGYDAMNTCNVLDSKLRSGLELQNHRPKMRVWFGQRDPYIAQDEALFGCLACNQMCQKFHIVKECMHSDFFRCLAGTDLYDEYLGELFNIFKR